MHSLTNTAVKCSLLAATNFPNCVDCSHCNLISVYDKNQLTCYGLVVCRAHRLADCVIYRSVHTNVSVGAFYLVLS